MPPSTEPASALQLRGIWRRADAAVERDVLACWSQGADLNRRLKNLCVVAYKGGKIVGTLETPLRRIEILRTRLAMIRLAGPTARHGASLGTRLLPARLVVAGQTILEDWSRAHPEEQVMGVGAIVPPGTYGPRMKRAVWEPTGLILANQSPQGVQLRVSWFAHGRVEYDAS